VKPDVDRLLEVAADELMARLGPALPTSYQRESATGLGAMLLNLREEFERAAERRVEENAELRRIFAEAAPVVVDGQLRERLEQAARGRDTKLAVSALERTNGELRGLLIELHAHVEELDSAAARNLDEQIWRELVRSTERRKLAFAVF
jgi:FKBP-type peptidyl-prolyl cis-trans isomerase (trigger factor)